MRYRQVARTKKRNEYQLLVPYGQMEYYTMGTNLGKRVCAGFVDGSWTGATKALSGSMSTTDTLRRRVDGRGQVWKRVRLRFNSRLRVISGHAADTSPEGRLISVLLASITLVMV